MQTCPELAREEEGGKDTPMHLAVIWNKIVVLRVLLEHDHSLGYVVSTDGITLLNTAAFRGHVDVAREILKHCPDTLSRNTNAAALTCLHTAVNNSHMEFVKFVLGSQQLRKL
jgi:ankyrin repeat protein